MFDHAPEAAFAPGFNAGVLSDLGHPVLGADVFRFVPPKGADVFGDEK